MKTTKSSMKLAAQAIFLTTALYACGENLAKEDLEKATNASKPGDSQGLTSEVTIQFATMAKATALNLVQSLDLGNGIVLTDARVNIGKIKIKPEEQEDEEESQLEEEFEALEVSKEQELESQEALWEEELDKIEADYEAQIKNAKTSEEKKSLEAAQKAAEDAVEAKIAAAKKVVEDELEALEAEKDGDLKWKGSFVYDIIQNAVSPAIPTVSMFDGTYRRIEFELKPNRTLDSSNSLLNRTVVMAGSVTLSGAAVPFTFSLRTTEDFKLAGAEGATMQPSVANSLVIGFNPAAWFTGIDFSTAVKDANGVIVIDDVTNITQYGLIKKNIKSSAKFGKDDDGDGELEDGESGGEAVETEE